MSSILCESYHDILCVLHREELDRKMDHKRQQIHSGSQEIRQLEQKVNQFRDEKVGHGGRERGEGGGG